MPCSAEITRRFPTREGAFKYLFSRGFLCVPSGWENGRWAATVDGGRAGCNVRVWLRLPTAA
jgi:hypothetical protein